MLVEVRCPFVPGQGAPTRKSIAGPATGLSLPPVPLCSSGRAWCRTSASGLPAVGADHFTCAEAEELLRDKSPRPSRFDPPPACAATRAIRRQTSADRRITSAIWPKCSSSGRSAAQSPAPQGRRTDADHRHSQRRGDHGRCRPGFFSSTTSESTSASAAPLGCTPPTAGLHRVARRRPVKSCTTLAVQADGHQVRTVEDLDAGGALDPVQEVSSRTRAAVRILHARHADDGPCPPRCQSRPGSATIRRRSRGTSVAAPVTRTSCAPSAGPLSTPRPR